MAKLGRGVVNGVVRAHVVHAIVLPHVAVLITLSTCLSTPLTRDGRPFFTSAATWLHLIIQVQMGRAADLAIQSICVTVLRAD
jgi:hypothetical protein